MTMSVAPMTKDMYSLVDPVLHFGRGPRPVRQVGQLGRQASTLREMLRSLETLTVAGQRHTMEKIVAFLAEHLRGAGRKLGPRTARTWRFWCFPCGGSPSDAFRISCSAAVRPR